MSEPSSRSLERVRELLDRSVVRDIKLPALTHALALAIDAARAEERERCEEIALRYKLESYIAEQIANAIHNEKIGESEERTSAREGRLSDG